MQPDLEITMLGTLPPLKGNAYYCWALSRELAKSVRVNFISFKKLYPDFLYPGGTLDKDPRFSVSSSQNLKITRLLTYYNPFTWICAGLKASGRLVHAQWWSIPVGLVWIVIFVILKMRRKQIILTVHNVLPHEKTKFDKILTRLVFSFVDLYFVHSSENAEQMRTVFGVQEHRIRQIPMGVHDMYGADRKTAIEAKRELNLPLNSKVILYFGNIRKYKGVDDLIKATSILKDKIPGKFYLLLVGKPWLDWNNYERLIKESGIEQITKAFLDYIPMSGVNKFFLASDLVVLPYKNFEAQSGVGNIALAFHKPLIVTRVGGLPNLVKNKVCIAEPNNSQVLANRILEVITNPRLMQELTQDSIELCAKYSWEAVAHKTLTVYKTI